MTCFRHLPLLRASAVEVEACTPYQHKDDIQMDGVYDTYVGYLQHCYKA
jgi:hypothetical protein